MGTKAALPRTEFLTIMLVTIPFVIVGALGVGWSIAVTASTVRFLAGSATTTGTVIDNHLGPRHRHGWRGATPEISFTASGRTITFSATVESSPQQHEKGDTVPVRYRPDDPQDARLDTFHELWMTPMMVLLAGTILGGGPLTFLIRAVRRRPE